MARLTRVKDEYECRIDGCSAEDWMLETYGHYPRIQADICGNCPFIKYINKLADYEDQEEVKMGIEQHKF